MAHGLPHMMPQGGFGGGYNTSTMAPQQQYDGIGFPQLDFGFERGGGFGGKGLRDDGGGFGFNKGTMDLVGSGMSAIGDLASAWAAIKGVGVAEDELDWKKDTWNQNFAQQMAAYRNNVTQIQNRQKDVNAWKAAQTPGGYEMAKLVV